LGDFGPGNSEPGKAGKVEIVNDGNDTGKTDLQPGLISVANNHDVEPTDSIVLEAVNGGGLSITENSDLAFRVGMNGQIITNQTTSATTLGSVARRMPIYNTSGGLIGYIPVYDSIT
jgi:hypothetical protein